MVNLTSVLEGIGISLLTNKIIKIKYFISFILLSKCSGFMVVNIEAKKILKSSKSNKFSKFHELVMIFKTI